MQNNTQEAKKLRKSLTGTVTSDKMDKTIVVRVKDLSVHPKYKKIIKRHSKFKVHDEKNQAKIGDIVKIAETRPISKYKRWHLLEVVNKRA